MVHFLKTLNLKVMEFKYFMGIDIGKTDLFAAVIEGASKATPAPQRYANTSEGIEQLIASQDGRVPGEVLVLIENTGHYGELLIETLHAKGFFVWLEAPNVLQKGLLKLNRLKDDPHDARMLASMARTHRDDAVRWEPAPADVQLLRDLHRRRSQIIRDRTRKYNQLHAENSRPRPNQVFVDQFKAGIKFDDDMVKQVNTEIDRLVASSQLIKRLIALLVSIPAIGRENALNIIIITECFTKIVGFKQLAAYICTAPYAKVSGTSGRQSRRVSKIGDRKSKSKLYLGVMSTATKPKGFWYKEYIHYLAKDKPHLVAVNNIINKIIKIIYALVKANKPFDKEFYINRRLSTGQNLHLS
jgi:transposase